MRHALETIDYTSDPPLHIPDKYKHMIWFALPIDIALMMIKQKETKDILAKEMRSTKNKYDTKNVYQDVRWNVQRYRPKWKWVKKNPQPYKEIIQTIENLHLLMIQ